MTGVMSDTLGVLVLISPRSRMTVLLGLNAVLILRKWNVMRKGKCVKQGKAKSDVPSLAF